MLSGSAGSAPADWLKKPAGLYESGRSTCGGNVISFLVFSNPVHFCVKRWRAYASLGATDGEGGGSWM